MKSTGNNLKVFIALTAVSVLGSAGLGYWLWGNAETADAKAASMRKELNASSGLPRKVEESRELLASSTQDLTHLELGVSTAEYVPTLLQELQITGKQCGLEIIGVRPVPKAAPKKKAASEDGKEEKKEVKKAYDELDVEVKVKGSFGSLMKFLQELANFPKIVGVRRVGVEPKVQPNGTTLEGVESTVVIRVYVFSSPAQAAATGTATNSQGATS